MKLAQPYLIFTMGSIRQLVLVTGVATALSIGLVTPVLATIVGYKETRPVAADKQEVLSEHLLGQASEAIETLLLISYDPPKKGGPKRSGGSGTR